jgi:hypothetical protein
MAILVAPGGECLISLNGDKQMIAKFRRIRSGEAEYCGEHPCFVSAARVVRAQAVLAELRQVDDRLLGVPYLLAQVVLDRIVLSAGLDRFRGAVERSQE